MTAKTTSSLTISVNFYLKSGLKLGLALSILPAAGLTGCSKSKAKTPPAPTLSLSGTVSAASQPATLLTNSRDEGTLGSQDGFELAAPAGVLDVLCRSVEATPVSCKATVGATGAFSTECNALVNKTIQCFVRNGEKVASPVYFTGRATARVGEGTLKFDVSLDVDSSYAAATVDTAGSTATVTQTLVQPFATAPTGSWKVACGSPDAANGFDGTARCPDATTVYLNSLDASRVSFWESKDAFAMCGSDDARPRFKVVLGGAAAQTLVLDYGTQASLFAGAQDIVNAFFANASTDLRTALDAAVTARLVDAQAALTSVPTAALPTGLVVPTLRTGELQSALVFDLLSLRNDELTGIDTACTALAAKSAAITAAGQVLPLGQDALCRISDATKRATAVEWIKKTRAASCIPQLQFGRLFDATSSQLVEAAFCPGSGQSGACVDANGTYLGQVSGRWGVARVRTADGQALEFTRVGAESLKVVNGTTGLQTCKNIDLLSIAAHKTSESVLVATASSLVVRNCRENGRARNPDELLSSVEGAKNLPATWSATFTKQP